MQIAKRISKQPIIFKPGVLGVALLLAGGSANAGLLGGLLDTTKDVVEDTTQTVEDTLDAVNVDAKVASVGMDFSGWVTMLDPQGRPLQNPNFLDEPRFNGWRTPVSGSMVLNITNDGLVGKATFGSFKFFFQDASGRDVTFVSAHTLLGVPSDTLLIGNMLFDFGATRGIPVSVVLDVGGLTTALQSTAEGQVLKGLLTAESDNTQTPDPSVDISIGPVLVATTAWNTTDVDTDGDGQPGPLELGDNPSGTTPLIRDMAVDATNGDIGIGGSPMSTLPFQGFSPNFDIEKATVTCVSAILSDCEAGGLSLPKFEMSAQPLEPLVDLLNAE
ncbi:MAG: hypothetical protein CMN57_00305 [Gammaproteobacteria bacterium]|nr:hypothetical protein [Gammaproteobacteria bacterium]